MTFEIEIEVSIVQLSVCAVRLPIWWFNLQCYFVVNGILYVFDEDEIFSKPVDKFERLDVFTNGISSLRSNDSSQAHCAGSLKRQFSKMPLIFC